MHLLGDVRCGVVDHDALPRGRGADAEPGVGQAGGHLLPDEPIRHGDVQKARTGHVDAFDTRVVRDRRRERLGQLDRLGAGALGQRERRVRLEVGVLGSAHQRIGPGQLRVGVGDGFRHAVGDPAEQRRHVVVGHWNTPPSRCSVSQPSVPFDARAAPSRPTGHTGACSARTTAEGLGRPSRPASRTLVSTSFFRSMPVRISDRCPSGCPARPAARRLSRNADRRSSRPGKAWRSHPADLP